MKNQKSGSCLIIAVFVCLFFNIVSIAQTNRQSNTLRLTNRDAMPKAAIEDVAWMAGHWRGELFGGVGEEIWSKPFGGTMMGMFKHVVGGKVTFYELMTIVEESNSLILKLKHFNADLTAWEEKEETVDFPLVKITPTEIFFDGYTYQKIDENTIQCYLRVQKEGQAVTEADWVFRRVGE